MNNAATQINEKEFAKLTTVPVTHEFGKLKITHTYLVENDEYQKALKDKSIEYFSENYFEFEKELGLFYQDTVDEKGKIVAAVITQDKDGELVHEHYNKGKEYNFLESAQKYRTDTTGKIIWAWSDIFNNILSTPQLAAFNARNIFYKNKDLSIQTAQKNLTISDFSFEKFDQAVKIADSCKPE
jgi:hypothetical protein